MKSDKLPLEPFITCSSAKIAGAESIWGASFDRFRAQQIDKLGWLKIIQSQSDKFFNNPQIIEGWFGWVSKQDSNRHSLLSRYFRWTVVKLLENICSPTKRGRLLAARTSECGLVCGANVNGMLIVQHPLVILAHNAVHTIPIYGGAKRKHVPLYQIGYVRVYPEQVQRLRH